MDLIFPPSARVSRARVDIVSNTAASRSIFTGAVRSTARAGDRWRAGLSIENASDRETYALRSQLKAHRSALRGQSNRVMLTDPSYVQRGSFPSAECFANNTFANGSTGWSAYSDYSVSVSDRVYRASALGTSGQGTGGPGLGSYPAVQAPSITQYAPYVTRGLVRPWGANPQPVIYSSIHPDAPQASFADSDGGGYMALSWVAVTGGNTTGIYTPAIGPAGTGIDISWLSLSRCALLDIGPNMLLRSDEFDNAQWTKSNTTVSANTGSTLAPNGTSTADNIVETTANGGHQVSQAVTVSSSARDYAFSVALKTNGRSHCTLQMGEGTGSTFVTVYFNMSTGAAGTTATGANWSGLRTFSTSLGNGWRQYTIVARKTNAATALTCYVGLATGDGTGSYTGNTGFGMFAWRATLAQSSVPSRLVSTSNTATSGGSPGGSSCYLKGLPASTTGLAKQGDLVEIFGSGLHRFIAPLDSDACGLGVAQFEPNVRDSALVDNTPMIFCYPLGRFVLTENEGGWDDAPGGLSGFDFSFEESLD